MKFLDKWFYRKARWCWHRAGIEYPELKAEQDFLDEQSKSHNGLEVCIPTALIDRALESNVDLERPIRFKVAAAEGGMILEVCVYDEKKDRNIVKHHIIPDDVEDKAAAIAKIVSWEFLRRPT